MPRVNVGGEVYDLEADGVAGTVRNGMTVVSVGEVGPQGPPGPSGPAGLAGPAGPTLYDLWIAAGNEGTVADFLATLNAAEVVVRYRQGEPSTHWEIEHSFTRPPEVLVIDSAGTSVLGDIAYPTPSLVVVEFGYPFGGEAFLT